MSCHSRPSASTQPFPSILCCHFNPLLVLHYIHESSFWSPSFVLRPSSAHIQTSHSELSPLIHSSLILSILVTLQLHLCFSSWAFLKDYIKDPPLYWRKIKVCCAKSLEANTKAKREMFLHKTSEHYLKRRLCLKPKHRRMTRTCTTSTSLRLVACYRWRNRTFKNNPGQ